jgi:putative transposase
MIYQPGNIIHAYNRGNNKQQIFFNEDNYRFFVSKVGQYVKPHSDILAWCLMPNHFHFLLHINEKSSMLKKVGILDSTEFHNGFRMLQSSYAKAINKALGRTGSLFQQNTHFKLLNRQQSEKAHGATYIDTCFHYIHQNPLKAGFVNKMEDWNYSSFNEYLTGKESLCNLAFGWEILGLSTENFHDISYAVLKPELIKEIF